jgi:hypothetical protein
MENLTDAGWHQVYVTVSGNTADLNHNVDAATSKGQTRLIFNLDIGPGEGGVRGRYDI